MHWLIEKLNHQNNEVRLSNWALLAGIIALALIWYPKASITLIVLAEMLLAASFLVWAIPVLLRWWDHPIRRIIGGLFVVISGVFQVWAASVWIGSVTGFHPGDYPTTVASLAVLLYLPTSIALVLLLLFLGSCCAALLSIPVSAMEAFASGVFGSAKSEWGECLGRRAIGGLCVSAVLITSYALLADRAEPHLNTAVAKLVKTLEYFPARQHPWRTSFGESLVHFHDNGLVTRAVDRDGATHFEIAIPPSGLIH
jgi:hypothetical protein